MPLFHPANGSIVIAETSCIFSPMPLRSNGTHESRQILGVQSKEPAGEHDVKPAECGQAGDSACLITLPGYSEHDLNDE